MIKAGIWVEEWGGKGYLGGSATWIKLGSVRVWRPDQDAHELVESSEVTFMRLSGKPQEGCAGPGQMPICRGGKKLGACTTNDQKNLEPDSDSIQRCFQQEPGEAENGEEQPMCPGMMSFLGGRALAAETRISLR